MAVMLKRYRFTVEEYERLAEAQALTQCDRVELLDGEIVEMSPHWRPSRQRGRPADPSVLEPAHRAAAWYGRQNPLRLRAVRSMPQPDVVLLRSRADFYAAGKPGPDDVLLLIEVMDASARERTGG